MNLDGLEYPAGWYVYFDSAPDRLSEQARRLRARKQRPCSILEHIAARAVESHVLPVRRSTPNVTDLAEYFAPLLQRSAHPAHDDPALWYSSESPLRQPDFQQRLEAVRMIKHSRDN